MFNVQSPTFSSSSKIDLVSKLSPSFRNKRIPSGQDSFTCHWNRVNSCKKLDSPSKSEKIRKRSHNSQQRVKTKVNLSYNLVEQINTLKNQYSSIKAAYQDLITAKVKNDQQMHKYEQENKRLREDNEKMSKQNERISKQNEKLKNKIAFLEMQAERIKRESLKLIEIEQFKALKLEENLAQKQKAISTLIESFKIDSNLCAIVSTNQSQPKASPYNSNSSNNQNHNLVSLESLTFSHDKTLSNSQFISISLTSMMENESNVRQDLSTKRNNLSYLDHDKIVIDAGNGKATGNDINAIIHVVDKTNKENECKVEDTFKKFRKEISKKIQVNIDDRNKELVLQAKSSGLDRKNSKSNKASKAKLKRDESVQQRSSKKKIMNK